MSDINLPDLFDKLNKLNSLYEKSTQGKWEWWTSNSYNRLKSNIGHGKTENVAYAYQASDGLNDIAIRKEDRDFIEQSHNLIPGLIDITYAIVADYIKYKSLFSDEEVETKEKEYREKNHCVDGMVIY